MSSPTVLITRPLPQAKHLREQLEAIGVGSVVFPTIEIVPLLTSEQLIQQLSPEADYLIVTSVHAVRESLSRLTTPCIAVGRATAKALAAVGVHTIITPEQFSSEGLLALPQLQDVQYQQITLLSGVGGRNVLAHALAGTRRNRYTS